MFVSVLMCVRFSKRLKGGMRARDDRSSSEQRYERKDVDFKKLIGAVII